MFAWLLIGIIAILLSIDIESLVFDFLVPIVPGEKLQALGVYVISVQNLARRFQKTISQRGWIRGYPNCDVNSNDSSLRVLVTVNKGGSVFGSRITGMIASTCGYRVGFGHNPKCSWPPLSDYLPETPASQVDIYMALPISSNWEQYAFSNQTRKVKCVVFTRDPFSRWRSLFQYAFEGGEPALYEYSRELHKLNTWKERVDWAWTKFGKSSMEITHQVLSNAIKRKECTQLKFDDFSKNFDKTLLTWLQLWGMQPLERIYKQAITQDLNRLTPEQKAKHNHVSGSSFTKQDILEVKELIAQHLDIMETLGKQSKDLNY